MTISKPVSATMNTKGSQPAAMPSEITKPANTFNSVWPASMLAKRRTLSEIGRDRYEIISIGTSNGAI